MHCSFGFSIFQWSVSSAISNMNTGEVASFASPSQKADHLNTESSPPGWQDPQLSSWIWAQPTHPSQHQACTPKSWPHTNLVGHEDASNVAQFFTIVIIKVKLEGHTTSVVPKLTSWSPLDQWWEGLGWIWKQASKKYNHFWLKSIVFLWKGMELGRQSLGVIA